MLKTSKKLTAAVIAVAFLLVAPAANAAEIEKLVIEQDAPVLVNVPNGETTQTNTGDLLFFAADLRNAKGKKLGEVIGLVTSFDVTLDGVEEEDRFRELVFNMRKGQIVALGASQYVASQAPDFADDNAAVTIPIVGGTGEYFGARGTVTTKKRANGTYRHTFRLVR